MNFWVSGFLGKKIKDSFDIFFFSYLVRVISCVCACFVCCVCVCVFCVCVFCVCVCVLCVCGCVCVCVCVFCVSVCVWVCVCVSFCLLECCSFDCSRSFFKILSKFMRRKNEQLFKKSLSVRQLVDNLDRIVDELGLNIRCNKLPIQVLWRLKNVDAEWH